MRSFLVLLLIVIVPMAYGDESGANTINLCEKAIRENTDYYVLGIYGSPLESEWHPAATYVLMKRMYRYDLLRKEFHKKSDPLSFEFVEMSDGKTMVFVYNLEIRYDFCNGPNAFYVKKK